MIIQKENIDNICNICSCPYDKLSQDHVPPKCMGNFGDGTYWNYLQRNGNQRNSYSDGIKFKTICKECYRKLKVFDDAISVLYKTMKFKKVIGNQKLTIKIKPNAIIRGIFGHFLSAKSFHERSSFDEIFYNSVISKEQFIPPSLQFYVVYYESDEIRIFRDLIVSHPNSHYKPVALNIMKIKPFAFLIAESPFLNDTVMNWTKYFTEAYNKKIDVEINTHIGCPNYWPENDQDFARLHGKAACESIIGLKNNYRNVENHFTSKT